MDIIYLDNSATTALSPGVKEAMTQAMECYGNPSSLHTAGMNSAALLKTCREGILAAAGAKKGWQLTFTGSGSEANNLAIYGAAAAGKHWSSKRIITTDSEHPSVMKSADAAQKQFGFEHVLISTKGGEIDLAALESELKKGAAIVSLMLVNNETGALYDIPAASALVRKYCPDAILHCDAVQGFMRVPLPLGCVDAITVSAHKIHGPKGCGALLMSDSMVTRKAFVPVINGGGQENGLRAGTENLVCIAGLHAAASEAAKNYDADNGKLDELYAYAVGRISETGCRVNVPACHVSHIISVTLPGIKSQTALSFLSASGICVSSGSACSSKDRHISPSLHAFGLSDSDADSTIRVSLCADNKKEDIDALCAALRDGMARLIRVKR